MCAYYNQYYLSVLGLIYNPCRPISAGGALIRWIRVCYHAGMQTGYKKINVNSLSSHNASSIVYCSGVSSPIQTACTSEVHNWWRCCRCSDIMIVWSLFNWPAKNDLLYFIMSNMQLGRVKIIMPQEIACLHWGTIHIYISFARKLLWPKTF